MRRPFLNTITGDHNVAPIVEAHLWSQSGKVEFHFPPISNSDHTKEQLLPVSAGRLDKFGLHSVFEVRNRKPKAATKATRAARKTAHNKKSQYQATAKNEKKKQQQKNKSRRSKAARVGFSHNNKSKEARMRA